MSDFPRLSPRTIIQNVGHRETSPIYLVLDPDGPAWLLVNDDGRRILERCNGENSPEAIARAIAGKDNGTMFRDVLSRVKAFLHLASAHRLFMAREDVPRESRFRGIALEITSRCNLQCIHCYMDAGFEPIRELRLEVLIDIIRSVKRAGGVSVAIGGGEPLLRDDCYDVIDAALSEDLLVAIGTNGTLLERTHVERLSRRPVKIQVSLDGATAGVHDAMRGQGSFDATVRGIDRLIEAGKGGDVCLACTVVKHNVREVPAIIDFALKRGIPVIQFPPLAAAGRARPRYNDLNLHHDELLGFWGYVYKRALELKGKMDLLADCFSLSIDRAGTPYRCAIGTQFRVDPAGDVYPCQCFHGGDEFCLGNVSVTPLEAIVHGNRIRQIIEMCDDRPARIEQCRQCRWVNFCGSGCMGSAYEETGTVFMPQACEARKQWIETQFATRVAKI